MMTSRTAKAIYLLPVLFALSAPLAQAQGSMTRVEQNDPAVVYSGNWYSNSTASNSGGSAALTNTNGSRVTLTFNGTGIDWIGVTDGWSGLGTVFLDGTMKIVDTYGSPTRYQQRLFSARGLSSGPHTLAIEITHERGNNTQGSWVWIDAFDIENGSALPGGVTANTGRVEESNPALSLNGRWYSNSNPAHSGGTSIMATDAGSRVTIAFNGTGVRWIAYRDQWSGIARVYLDGVLKTTVDTYLSPSQAQTVPYSISGLSPGTHTLAIEATGTRSASSQASWVWVDAFDVTQ
jgi:alpha-galactosidase